MNFTEWEKSVIYFVCFLFLLFNDNTSFQEFVKTFETNSWMPCFCLLNMLTVEHSIGFNRKRRLVLV